ncbi:glycosyltransferase family 4 protein [Marinobacter salicampi]|uniref:glycosyltransferase family 4 protein n=1 Tax=Marinobacter salicampi TaxID=435907 RepID=UPI00140CD2A1|nr:glycosyltransferase family 4 protein [Marinobacter salicampi]
MTKVANIVLNDFTNDSRVWKISKSLASFGYHPIVVALHRPGLETKESVAGVCVYRIPLATRSWPKFKPIQIVKYFEFACKVFWRFRGVNYVHCNDLNALPIGLLIKLFSKKTRVVYDCHEYETEITGLKGVEKNGRKLLERCLIPFVDSIITVSDSIANEYARLYKIPQPHLVLNCPSHKEQPKNDLFRKNLGIRADQTIFLYQGGLSKGRGVELLLEAFTALETDQNVLVCMGYGPLEQLIQHKSQDSETIFFHSAVMPDVLLNYTSSADYGVSFIEDSCLSYRYCLPNKVFEYLMAGLPVLTSNLYEMKKLVETEGVGIVAEDNTVEGFRKAVIRSLAQDYKAIQKNVFDARKKYCWEEQEKTLGKIYGAL